MGLLVSLAIFIGMFTNLLILPALLLSLEKYVKDEVYKEPYFLIFDEEEDIELDNLKVEKTASKTRLDENKSDRNTKEEDEI